jgi:hypothetical protein
VASELVRHALEALERPHERQKSKAERALQLIEESKARKLQMMEGLTPGRCGYCNGLAFMYQPPAMMVWKCRSCMKWNRIEDVGSQ